MNRMIRSLALTAALSAGMAAMAQQPYSVTISGQVIGCNANSFVNIASMPGTQPSIDIDVPVLPSSCSFTVTLNMASQGGGFNVSIPCNGAIQSQVVQYQVPPVLDSTAVFVTFNCGSTTPDCLGVPGGSALPGTPCQYFGDTGIWSSQCQCIVTTGDCEVCFTASQATDGNGDPIPFTAAFSNCSSGGTGSIEYIWDFPSTAITAFETSYTYNGPGTWLACLNMYADGCNSSVCDTVLFDANGMLVDGPVVYDCLQVPNGPNVPGTPCTNPTTGETGTWSADCACIPNTSPCQACFTIASPAPWTMAVTNCTSGGSAPYTYQWWLPDGTSSTSTNQDWTFTTEGVYGICLTIVDANGCTSSTCDTVVVDANGGISTDPVIWDCLQIANGPNLPGTPCTNPATGATGTWSADCTCITNSTGCQAGFWVIQAYEGDSLSGEVTPIPYELWVWNLSSGTSPFQFLWNFGDGTTSTDPYPTHVYAQSGPYNLCLTLTDASGCTSTSCDSVSIDGNGLYDGMVPVEEAARNGFTIRVVNELPTGIADQPAYTDTRLWPNPVNEVLNLRFNTTLRGNLPMNVVDVNGRVVLSANAMIADGTNQLEIATGSLPAGMYMLRMGSGQETMSFRFVKN